MQSFVAILKALPNRRLFCVLVAITAAFIFLIFSLSAAYDRPSLFYYSSYSNISLASLATFLFLFVLVRAIYVMAMVRPSRLTISIFNDIRMFCSAERLITALPILILLPFFFAAFTAAKNLIPAINPFSWDATLSYWDRFLHFGQHPWEWLQAPITALGATMFISFCYRMWFIIKVMVIYWQSFSLKNPLWREEFFVALLLIWSINGFVLATLLSSAGPLYYDLVYPEQISPYRSLMEYLHQTEIYDLLAQEWLWQAYIGKVEMPLSGISAAPSMHVSLACLYALHGWRYGGLIRWGFVAFLIVTLIGSVHLAWHYAIDGYIALASTSVIWLVTKRLLCRTQMPVTNGKQCDDAVLPAGRLA